MPPRHVYWTIILEGKPTAFRAHDREELLPTLRQLQSRHPDAVMKWFARGRLWNSQEEERAASHQPRGDRRPPSWRPGGMHEDPRERFQVPRAEKRRRFAEKRRRDSRDEQAGEEHVGRPPSRRPPSQRPPSQRPPSLGAPQPPGAGGRGPGDRFRDREGRGSQRPGPGNRGNKSAGPGGAGRPPSSFRGRGPSGPGQRAASHRSGPKNGWRKPGGGRRGGGGGSTR